MTDPVVTWHAEHARFARLLDVLDGQVSVFHAGGQPNHELMLNIMYYLRHYPDRIHHPQENVAFGRLLVRDPTMKPQIDQLLQEHDVIAAAGEAILERLTEMVAGTLEPRSLVEAAAATYLAYYRHHIATENKLIPRAAQLLTVGDWMSVAAAVPVGPDPLIRESLDARYRALRRQIALEAQSG